MSSSKYWTDDTIINEYIQKGGNPFIAVQQIAAEARARAESHNNIISHSEALAWVITGDKPAVLEQDRRAEQTTISYDIINDHLAEVSDPLIREAVFESVQKSIRGFRLTFCYMNITDSCIQAKIRVLVRMIYDEILDAKYGG